MIAAAGPAHAIMMAGSCCAVAKARACLHIHAMSRVPFLSGLCLALALAGGAQAASSGWHHVEGGSIRIVTSGAPDAAGNLRGALEIRLKPGWKTYWLDPGASGVPPTLTAAAGDRDAEVEIGFPSPSRFDDGYALWAGYDRPVSLALTMALPDSEDGPTQLEANVFLGVCETICIPVQATLAFDPRNSLGDPADAAVVEAAFAALPGPARRDFSASLAEADEDAIVIAPVLPQGVRALDLFVAGTASLSLGTPERTGEGGDGAFRVPVSLRTGSGSETVTYTLVTDAGAVTGVIEVPQR